MEYRYDIIEKKAQIDKAGIENDFTYFINHRQEVNATFYRFLNDWKDKVIVVDVTCSMDPYTDQVLSWMAMQLSNDENCQFVFFNDGDGKPLSDKIIGATGGMHFSDSPDIVSVMNTFHTNGSIHTIREDIMNLKELVDNEELKKIMM